MRRATPSPLRARVERIVTRRHITMTKAAAEMGFCASQELHHSLAGRRDRYGRGKSRAAIERWCKKWGKRR